MVQTFIYSLLVIEIVLQGVRWSRFDLEYVNIWKNYYFLNVFVIPIQLRKDMFCTVTVSITSTENSLQDSQLQSSSFLNCIRNVQGLRKDGYFLNVQINEVYAILTHSQLQFFDKNLETHERLNQIQIFNFSLFQVFPVVLCNES